MRLGDLIQGLTEADVPEHFLGEDIVAVHDDSRRVVARSLFAAVPGPVANGEAFIPDAVRKGARVVVCAAGGGKDLERICPDVCFIRAVEPQVFFREVVRRFYGDPSKRVKVMGVTGTNGKTTVTYLLEAVAAAMGRSAGVVGTVNCRVRGQQSPTKNTTPGFLDNQIFLKRLSDDSVDHAIMEVSSHALVQGRVDLIDFRTAVFTNLTGDHLDYHKTMDGYFEAKSRLFTGLSRDARAVINVDDPYGQRLVPMTSAKVMTYGVHADCDVKADIGQADLNGTWFAVRFWGRSLRIHTPLIGFHNVYNVLAAFAAGLAEGFPPEKIKEGIEGLAAVPGRLERVSVGKDFFIFIDYAHTDDGLMNVLKSLKDIPHNRLIVVFGCGGDRDRTKRPRMGRIACELADVVILTSDNPRSEDPLAIIDEIIPGFTRKTYEVVADRREAIERALTLARKDDIVLLAGKGHETYQVLKEGTVDFVERDIVEDVLRSGKARG